MNIIFQVTILIFIYMCLNFIIALIKKDNSIVDIAWGLGFVLIAYYTLFVNSKFLITQLLVTTLVTIWGLRLGYHLYLRKRGKDEDYRYKAWREKWGKLFFIRSFLQIFMLQGFFMIIISYSIIHINSSDQPASLVFTGIGWTAIISPILITLLLLKVSGVPLLEKHFEKREGWDEYKRKTNKFIPWFPKKI